MIGLKPRAPKLTLHGLGTELCDAKTALGIADIPFQRLPTAEEFRRSYSIVYSRIIYGQGFWVEGEQPDAPRLVVIKGRFLGLGLKLEDCNSMEDPSRYVGEVTVVKGLTPGTKYTTRRRGRISFISKFNYELYRAQKWASERTSYPPESEMGERCIELARDALRDADVTSAMQHAYTRFGASRIERRFVQRKQMVEAIAEQARRDAIAEQVRMATEARRDPIGSMVGPRN